MVDRVAVEAGRPVDRILDHIHQGRYDLVIMGSHGHGIIKEALIGSTSRKVLKHSPKPVLIVPSVGGDRDS
jgi:nucleotide-binding universal stress UspA family protein